MYKYMEKQYADGLIAKGSIRVGTLHDFRSSEHKKGIADLYEGRKAIHHPIKKHVITAKSLAAGGDPLTRMLHQTGAVRMSGNARIELEGVPFTANLNQPDLYILCVSSAKSQQAMSQFGAADTCIEIVELDKFFHYLSQAIAAKVGGQIQYQGCQKVVYRERSEAWNGSDLGVPPHLIKDPTFAPQDEIRAIWMPMGNRPIKPEIIEDSRLSKLCKEVQV